MTNRILFFLVSSVLLLLSFCATAQVQVSVAIPPPYSPYIKDYVKDGAGVLLTLTNTSGQPQSLKLIASITGNNGVSIAVKESFMPVAPIVLAPNETKMLTGATLKAFNSNLTEGNVQYAGLDVQNTLFSGKLPEGFYQYCIKAMRYSPAPAALGNAGCASINVVVYDPPIVMNPGNSATVKPQNPQFIPFSWTPSGGGGITKYSLRIVDMTLTNLNNPNDAFLNEAIQPFFKQDGINTTSYIYDNAKPKLTEAHRYAVMVVASDPKGKLQFKNSGRSEVTTFLYKNPAPADGPVVLNNNPNSSSQADAPAGPCLANAEYSGPLSSTPAGNVPDGTEIAVGLFVMKNTTFAKEGGGYKGTGEILVNFLGVKLKVEFTNIRINASNRMYAGLITGRATSNTVIDQGMRAVKTGPLESVPDMDGLMGYLDQGIRQVNKADPNKIPVPLDLPLNFKKEDWNLGIVGVMFEPTGAYANALLNTPLPMVAIDEYLILGIRGVPIHPNGYGTDAILKVALASDRPVKLSDKVSLTFKGGADKCFATFDCTGFKEITLNGAYTLDRSLALPVDNNYSVIENASVKVSVPFTITAATSFKDVLLSDLSFSHRFALPQARDFVITGTGLTLDFSSTQNSPGFGTAYPAKAAKKDWTGVFVKDLSLTLPAYLKGDGSNRITLAVQHGMMDKLGFQGMLSAEGNPLKSGKVAGWGLDIKKVLLNIENSSLKGGALDGAIRLPLGENISFAFTGTVSAGGSDGTTVGFKVTTINDVNANLFLAKMNIASGSTISLKKIDGIFTATATLHGAIGIDITKKPDGGNVSKLKIPGLNFQSLTIKGVEGKTPEFNIGFAALQDLQAAQAKISGAFELNLNSLQFKSTGGGSQVGLAFGLGMSILGGAESEQSGAGVTTDFTINARYDKSAGTFKYFDSKLDAISIDANIGVAQIKGSINIYDEDQTFGNGFRGDVNARVKGLDVAVGITAQFGRTLANKGDYKYWYFDAMASFGGVGIQVPGTAASIYGFGGGAWYNMAPSELVSTLKPNQYASKNSGNTAAPTHSGVSFVPAKEKSGFRAAVMFGLSGSKNAFNGDLKFSMSLRKNMGIDSFALEGNAYLMQNPDNASKRNNNAFVHCMANIRGNIPKKAFYGNFKVDINVARIIDGGGELAIKFDRPSPDDPTSKWFIKVGSWTPNVDPFIDKARLHAHIGFDAAVVKADVTFQAYFMVGNDIENGLPPLPAEIYELVKYDGAPKKKPVPAVISDDLNLAFAFGAGLKVEAGFDFFILSANLMAMAGFDILLANAHVTCNGKEAGLDGWYAQGQAYAMLKGDMKLFRKIPVAEFVAGAVLQFKGPNPNYVYGDVVAYIDIFGKPAGEYRGYFSKGQLCEGMQVDFDPFNNVKLIRATTPEKTTPNTTGFSPFGKMEVSLAYAFEYWQGSYIKAYDAFNNKAMTFKFLTTMHLKDKDGDEVPVKLVPDQYNNRLVRLYPMATLKEKSDYTLEIYAGITGNSGTEKEEVKKVAFKTGAYPPTMEMQYVGDCYPLPGQRYAMKQISNGLPMEGRLNFTKDLSYFTTKWKDQMDLYVRFKEAATGDVLDIRPTSLNPEGYMGSNIVSSLVYNMPNGLKPSTIYQMSVVMKPKQGTGNINNFAAADVVPIFMGYYFRTSMYGNFKQKFNDFKVRDAAYIDDQVYVRNTDYGMAGEFQTLEHDYRRPVVFLKGKENLDVTEYYGYKTFAKKTQYISGDLMFVSESSNWYKNMDGQYRGLYHDKLNGAERNFLLGLGVDQYTSLGMDFYGNEANNPWLESVANWETHFRTKGYLSASQGIARPDGPLTQGEIDEALLSSVQKKDGPSGSPLNTFSMGGAKKSGGGMQMGGGLNITPYSEMLYAIEDNTLKLAINLAEHVAGMRLEAASDAQLAKTWNLVKKMGFPRYPLNTHHLNFYYRFGYHAPQAPFATFSYTYAPDQGE